MTKRKLNIEAPLLDDYIFKRTFTKEGTEPLLKDFLELISGKGEKIEMAEKKNKNIEEALERVDEVMQDPEVMELYFNIAVSKWDYNSGMHYGKMEEKTEIAKKLKNQGIEIEIIMTATGLTKEEIEKL